ncbi:MAG: biopolymer transporter ExbD [Elusimicrobiota bacterium]|nr:biopolymer transporter ExbD [Endomicrobiia bacterium]MDW8165013.1 biopolymer transporter ExbD [Elusimicrobiota bacterium]
MKLKRKSKTGLVSLIDLAPMTDMVFQVLLFFILSSSFIVEPGIKVNLPKSQTSEIQVQQKLMITVDKNQQIFIENKVVPLENLEEKIKLLLPYYSDKLVIIRADKSVPHGLVVKIMDISKLAGAEKLAIATEKE